MARPFALVSRPSRGTRPVTGALQSSAPASCRRRARTRPAATVLAAGTVQAANIFSHLARTRSDRDERDGVPLTGASPARTARDLRPFLPRRSSTALRRAPRGRSWRGRSPREPASRHPGRRSRRRRGQAPASSNGAGWRIACEASQSASAPARVRRTTVGAGVTTGCTDTAFRGTMVWTALDACARRDGVGPRSARDRPAPEHARRRGRRRLDREVGAARRLRRRRGERRVAERPSPDAGMRRGRRGRGRGRREGRSGRRPHDAGQAEGFVLRLQTAVTAQRPLPLPGPDLDVFADRCRLADPDPNRVLGVWLRSSLLSRSVRHGDCVTVRQRRVFLLQRPTTLAPGFALTATFVRRVRVARSSRLRAPAGPGSSPRPSAGWRAGLAGSWKGRRRRRGHRGVGVGVGSRRPA